MKHIKHACLVGIDPAGSDPWGMSVLDENGERIISFSAITSGKRHLLDRLGTLRETILDQSGIHVSFGSMQYCAIEETYHGSASRRSVAELNRTIGIFQAWALGASPWSEILMVSTGFRRDQSWQQAFNLVGASDTQIKKYAMTVERLPYANTRQLDIHEAEACLIARYAWNRKDGLPFALNAKDELSPVVDKLVKTAKQCSGKER